MQKKLIALAIAGLASSAAFAQSNVTIYGRADYGFLSRGSSDGLVQGAKNKNEFIQGIAAGSRIGFKGAEDLGNGLKAIFEFEYGIGIDQATTTAGVSGTSAARWDNRHSYVGLTGGFGTAVAGRLDGVRYGIYNTYDPFAGGTVGNFTQMTNQVDRADNAIAYISPNFSGFTGLLAYSTNIAGTEGASSTNLGAPAGAAGAKVGNNSDLVLNTIMGKYENGPISVTADYEQIKKKGTEGKISVAVLAGSYDFGVVKVSALYDWDKNDIGATDQKSNAWFIGAKIPFAGKFAAKVNYGQVKDKKVDNADGRKFGIGLDYSLSKRTMVYVDYGKISNDSGAGYSISPAANTQTLGFTGAGAAVSGYGVRGFDFGIAHNF